ncbi:Lrp/AsnC family transcriptional regulator [Sphingomonas sp. KC8]|uniref:Lrp/AsnC family transcriptional regulator n=1 Tax=Sphingomonas sp. KC8 TaxID=1030157 RepID=UPI000248BB76|nr:Lrp/AsnC family transcriptional regulator [Sphingomonas sp. KC8]ARS25961.1 AsnC family transcriptional regulator [Sphingomonas sp. KC8]
MVRETTARNGGRGRGHDAAGYELDEIDERIIAALRHSGRIANRDLARIVDVNEATVRTRLRRLEDTSSVRVVAMRDLSAMGYECLSAVGIQVKGRSAADVGRDLAELEEVVTVNVAIGTHDLEVQVVAHDLADLDRLLTHVIAHIPGVEKMVPGLALKVLKYTPDWAPL